MTEFDVTGDDESVEYLRKHRVPQLLSAAAASCAQQRPERPLRWLSSYLSARAGGCAQRAQSALWLQSSGVSSCMGRAIAALADARPRPSDPSAWLAEWIEKQAADADPAVEQPTPPPRAGFAEFADIRETSSTADPPTPQKSCGEILPRGESHRALLHADSHRVTWAHAAPDYAIGDADSQVSDEMEETLARGVKVSSKVQMVEDVLEKMRAHLLGSAWGDVGEGVEDWLNQHRQELNALRIPSSDTEAEPPEAPKEQPPAAAAEEGEGECATPKSDESGGDRGGKVPENAAAGMTQVLYILRDTLAGHKRGTISVELQANSGDRERTGGGMLAFVQQLREIESDILQKGVSLSFQPFPVRKRRDDYREITSETHVLMLAQLRIVKPKGARHAEQAFEVFVNLVGHLHYKTERKRGFDHFDVIPSFGNLVNLQQPQQHKGLCSPDAVVRCRRLVEALHHFKLSLVRVAEHIIQTVIQGEFLHDVARRLSEVSQTLFNPEQEERRRSIMGGPRRHSVHPGTLRRDRRVSREDNWSRRQSAPIGPERRRQQSAPVYRDPGTAGSVS
eukprot:TRINITY_DN70618_c0_g1_i1.p1 TRINITY_DN70618_c0_g1~~TRINITY_DN70618_c0_g1_i1.p1  ORF type:complete len:590 (+),score=139.03 TRINITY_DN70618_c0_g1_i1:76-1770(+)